MCLALPISHPSWYVNDSTCAMNHLPYSSLLDILYIGDGGNDVSMIQAANVGVGIVGKVRMTLIVFASFG